MIATLAEVQKFLNSFHEKVKVFDILFFEERDKNIDALAELNLIPTERIEVIKTIEVTDYTEGPIKNILNSLGDLWVFGKISFHVAEHPLVYPYKK